MKILLDECVDSRLAPHFGEMFVRTVADQNWRGIANGKLLSLAAMEFDVFVTTDRNLSFQQHLPKYDIAVVLLVSKWNRLPDLVSLMPEVIQILPTAARGQVTTVGVKNPNQ